MCFVNFQVLRNNMNITVVEMTKNKTHKEGNITITQPPEFNWDTKTIGFVLSILSYGGLLSFLGTFPVNWFGGSVTCSVCMLVSGILTILHPAILYIDFQLFLACRILTGVFENFFYISTTEIFSRWIPKEERSTLISFSFNGTNVGLALTYPMCGYLAHIWGWQMVFYVTGIISVVVAVICMITVKNKPSQDTWISRNERLYILQETDHEARMESKSHPYKSILLSTPVWALCINIFTFIWVASILGTCLPLYIQDSTGKETDEIGLISCIPNAVYIFMFPICGMFMDYWKNNSGVTLTRIHKTLISTAFIVASVLFVGAAFITDFTTTLTFFISIQIIMAFVPLILQIVSVALAPDHSSVIAGMTTFSFSASSIISQTVTGFMIKNHTAQEWNYCFYLAAAMSVLGAVVFLLYGSSEPQLWSSLAFVEEDYYLNELDEKK
ncbi:vesicular glutamate transporter 3-like isoform X2 [Planococcus citri]